MLRCAKAHYHWLTGDCSIQQYIKAVWCILQSFVDMDTPRNLRELMVNLHNEGESWRRIATVLHQPKSTVSNILRRYKQTGSIENRRSGRCGRHRKLSLRDERALARGSVANPSSTARQLRSSVGGRAASVSLSTIKRALKRQGRVAQRPKKSPSLNRAQMSNRLRWCQQFSGWDAERWRKVRISCNPVSYVLYCFGS
jgi:transposase